MNTFITGATGYIGSQLAWKLAESGHSVHALVRNPEVTRVLDHPNIRLFKGDVNDLSSVKKAMEGCAQVYHLASLARLWAKPSNVFYKTNVDGARNILDAAVETHVSKLVYTSSTAVFGVSINQPLSEDDPRTIGFNNDYDLSKCMAEKLVMDYAGRGLHALIVNPSRVYGPGIGTYSNPFARFLTALLRGRPLIIPKCPAVVANYAYVRDVVDGHILAMHFGKAGERYILGGENVSYRELLSAVTEMIPGGIVIPMPKSLMKVAGGLQIMRFHVTRKHPSFTPSAIDRYYTNAAFSCQKAICHLDYKITPFRQGIASTINELKKQKNGTT